MKRRLHQAYKDLIKGDLNRAAQKFGAIADADARAKWGVFLVELLQDKFNKYPTYFEVRNFLELDLQMLIDNFKGEYVEKIAGYADFFFTVNPESYKFLARIMAANELYAPAQFFIERGLNRLYSDPELHFIIAGLELKHGRNESALRAIEHCLEILPGYYPALAMRKKLKPDGLAPSAGDLELSDPHIKNPL